MPSPDFKAQAPATIGVGAELVDLIHRKVGRIVHASGEAPFDAGASHPLFRRWGGFRSPDQPLPKGSPYWPT